MRRDQVGEVLSRQLLDSRRVVVLLLDEVQLRLESRISLRLLAVFLVLKQVLLSRVLDILELLVDITLLLLDCRLKFVQLLQLLVELLLNLSVLRGCQPERLLPLDQFLEQ